VSTAPAIAVIPARYGSSRFPGKPLADKTGKPLIQHVVERVRLAKRISRVILATDDQRIFDAAQQFGCEAVMTRSDHPNGTSRIAEVVEGLTQPSGSDGEGQVIVNVQGDEPQIEPSVIDELVDGLLAEPADGGAPMATLASTFAHDEDPHDPNIVKLVVARIDGRLRAMYFSRSLIPYDRGHAPAGAVAKPLKHPGLYAYRRDFLLRYVQLAPTPLEQTEQLEQLRALEHGYAIAVVMADVRHHGIDTPEQYEAFVRECGEG
jgi:3-deoxy-manno-octulosonate cytidylyltransferase (CMP-KDO synthetase)